MLRAEDTVIYEDLFSYIHVDEREEKALKVTPEAKNSTLHCITLLDSKQTIPNSKNHTITLVILLYMNPSKTITNGRVEGFKLEGESPWWVLLLNGMN